MSSKAKRKKNRFPRSLVLKHQGGIKPGFIAFIGFLVINAGLLLLMGRVSIEIELIVRRLFYLTIFAPIFGWWVFTSTRKHYLKLWKKNRYNPKSWKMLRREKARLVLDGLLSCFVVGIGIVQISVAIIDVVSEEQYLTATIVEVDEHYRLPDVITLSNGERYNLFSNGYDAEQGKKYRFRMMELSGLAIPVEEIGYQKNQR